MNLPHELTKDLRPFASKRFLLGVSGGLDSVVLFHVFLHFQKHFGFEFCVGHFHHGPASTEEQNSFRARAYAFVKELCKTHQISFFSNVEDSRLEDFLGAWDKPLVSEEQFRQARYDFFNQVLKAQILDTMALGHHADDLLETRVLRLLRGVGPESLGAMEFYKEGLLRPFIRQSQKKLFDWAMEKKLEWLEDPSNERLEPMRNWLRGEWLPQLEERWPGSLASLGRSLELLAHSPEENLEWTDYLKGDEVDLRALLALSDRDKRRVLAYYMRGQNLKNYGLSHINELIKRLDKEQKSHTFRLLGRQWTVDAGRMRVDGLA